MEFFNQAKVVRLRSHLDKYLVADDDKQTVRQSRNGSSRRARWTVELIGGKSHVIRLKSCHGRYLTASDDPFLLGMTGRKALQTRKTDISVEWEPIKDGYFVKLRTRDGGKFLRANGGTPPWRNSVTHDVPHRTATQDWVLWSVDVIDVPELESLPSQLSPASSFCPSPVADDRSDSDARRRSSSSSSLVSKKSELLSSRQSGMELFDRAKAVRLQSHLGKYLVADDDERTVRQSRSGSSQKARWTVEFVEAKPHLIRLKSCHGLYLTASDESFLLGMTGTKVLQTAPPSSKASDDPSSVEWEPIKEGVGVKLMSRDGKFLRGNGGTPPWRNSITHDVPQRTATQDWVVWGVDVVDISLSEPLSRNVSSMSSFSSSPDDFSGSPETGSPPVGVSAERSGFDHSGHQNSGMEFFRKAKTVRLRSHHDKFLLANDDQHSVSQDRNGSTPRSNWTVESVEGVETLIRLKSCYGKYLTATDDQFLLGFTGKKVLQTSPGRLDSSVEWEPVRDGFQVRLKTRYGNYLRANKGLPPWRNSITHDIPQKHSEWVLWDVEITELRLDPPQPKPVSRVDSLDFDPNSSSFHLMSPRFPKLEPRDSFDGSPRKSDGRIIYYTVVDEDGGVDDDATVGSSFNFRGHGLEELIQKLKEETGLEDIVVCSRNHSSGKLYPLRLHLPPNNATMHVVVVVPASSQAARDF